MADLENDVTMTPHEIAEQTRSPDVHNFQGLPQSPSPWDERTELANEKSQKEEAVRKTRRQTLQKEQEQQQEQQRKGAYDRKYQSYLAAMATQDLQAKKQGSDVDPEQLTGFLHMGMDAISGGVGSAVAGALAGKVVEADSEDRSESSEPEPNPVPPARPLQEN